MEQNLDAAVPFAVSAAQVEIPHLSLGLQAHIWLWLAVLIVTASVKHLSVVTPLVSWTQSQMSQFP